MNNWLTMYSKPDNYFFTDRDINQSMQVATCRPREHLLSKVHSGNNSSYKSIKTAFAHPLLWNHERSCGIKITIAPTIDIYKFKRESSHRRCSYSTLILHLC